MKRLVLVLVLLIGCPPVPPAPTMTEHEAGIQAMNQWKQEALRGEHGEEMRKWAGGD